jgi:hypothetical protein
MQLYSQKRQPIQLDKRLYSQPAQPSFQKYPPFFPQIIKEQNKKMDENRILSQVPYKKIFKDFHFYGENENKNENTNEDTNKNKNKNENELPFRFPKEKKSVQRIFPSPFSLPFSFSKDSSENPTLGFYSTLGFLASAFFIFTYREKIQSFLPFFVGKPLQITNARVEG